MFTKAFKKYSLFLPVCMIFFSDSLAVHGEGSPTTMSKQTAGSLLISIHDIPSRAASLLGNGIATLGSCFGQRIIAEGKMQKKPVAIIATLAAAGFGYKVITHWWKLYSLEKKLYNSIVGLDNDLPCVYWYHRNAKNIKAFKKAVDKKEIKLPNSEHSISNESDAKKELSREKEVIEKKLGLLGLMSDAPQIIKRILSDRELVDTKNKFFSSQYTEHDKLFSVLENADSTKIELDGEESLFDILQEERPSQRGMSILFRPEYFPWSWCIVPCYKKARLVYLQFLREYLHLKTLEKEVESWSVTTTGEALEDFSKQLQLLITSCSSTSDKVKFVDGINNLHRKIEEFSQKGDVSKNEKLKNVLANAMATLSTVAHEMFEKTPNYDANKRLLNSIKDEIDRICKTV